jgi:hypothetical protein
VWQLVMVVEFVHGTLRWIFLRPHVGVFRSGQIGVFTGSTLFLLVVYFCEPWMKLRSSGDCLRVGALWVGLTLTFEWSFGHYGMGRSLLGKHYGGIQLAVRGIDADRADDF